ncbi:tRNA (adenosine(37)-N6)-threonylcarbamoyltransferase complex ATPase subunit type 1 TsaE [Actinokineospora iranica]|uniref:tRNA threonylcarbamoyladenosine biosynthesis protein TsaE n=1 Tax=Actinokineospora iranica TaxID=1271860 RepID=A0A1G6V4E7_9PSEU|nr:tRNA (adenosine(37)-N6)-threonylcarbamoyltransferase complex ATPase subunit type 1 TsaE [Actinokineospora iranica]SDD48344.1 tRNA threonylcarbamoyladenosine biosynthesis protein TsaE [Actinokineospora iranica]
MPEPVTLVTAEDTLEFGRKLGETLRAGDLVLLAGPLGAGKTVVAKGIAAGLGVQGRVSSPTFIIAREHQAGERGIPLVHVDAYRLGGDLTELDDLDLDTELVESVVVVEWGEGAAERLSADHLLIRLDRRPDDARLAILEPHGSWVDRLARAGFCGCVAG